MWSNIQVHLAATRRGTYEDIPGKTRWSEKQTLVSIAECLEDWTAGKEAKKRRQYAVCEL